jgi:hypothetical protein
VFLRRKRHEFVVPELHLFVRRERSHVVNDRRLFLCDFINLLVFEWEWCAIDKDLEVA